MEFFKPEDFEDGGLISASCAAGRANAKLEKEGRVVYGNFYKGKFTTGWCSAESDKWKIEKAILVNIEKISEPCTHPKEKIKFLCQSFFQCECGKQMKPTAFEEIK